MNAMDKLPPAAQQMVKRDTFEHWLDSASGMMTGLAVMRGSGSLSQEEADDLLHKLLAIVKIGSSSLGYEANSSLDTFMEDARERMAESVQSFNDMLEDFIQKTQKPGVDKT